MPKAVKHYRLSDEAVRLLQLIASFHGLTNTAALEVLIRAQAKRMKIKEKADA